MAVCVNHPQRHKGCLRRSRCVQLADRFLGALRDGSYHGKVGRAILDDILCERSSRMAEYPKKGGSDNVLWRLADASLGSRKTEASPRPLVLSR